MRACEAWARQCALPPSLRMRATMRTPTVWQRGMLTRMPCVLGAVGLVVEGSHVSAVVPGGPCDKKFATGAIQEGDAIVEVDGQAHGTDSLPVVSIRTPDL